MKSRRVSWCAVVTLGWLGVASATIAQDCTLNEDAQVSGDDFDDTGYLGQSTAMDGANMIVGSMHASGFVSYRKAQILTFDGVDWAEQIALVDGYQHNNPNTIEYFHSNVAIDGDWAMLGAPQHQEVHAAWFNGSTWEDSNYPPVRDDPSSGERFGNAVAISSEVAVVGCFRDDGPELSGSVYIFRLNGSAWQQEQKLKAADNGTGDLFGSDVDIDGNTAVIGAKGDTSDKGAAYIFTYDGTWTQQQKLVPAGSVAGEEVGTSVAISGDLLVVGAPYAAEGDINPGAAYVYRYNGSSWVPHEDGSKLVAANAMDDMWFGNDVDIDNGVIVVGARYESWLGNEVGASYIFKHNGSAWEQIAKLLASDGGPNDDFGNSVAVSDEVFLIGAMGGGVSGAAYYFDPAAEDCNANGVYDGCESDCNDNGIPDDCDIADETSQDCQPNGIPDECELAPVVQLVFVIDTSDSMYDDATAMCTALLQEVEDLRSSPSVPRLDAWFLGVTQDPDECYGNAGEFYGSVEGLLGADVPDIPGDPPTPPPACCDTIGGFEDWGPATAVVSGLYPWQDGLRVVIPISDEAPTNGDPGPDCHDSPGEDDYEITIFARDMAAHYAVAIFPVLAKNPTYETCVRGHMERLVDGNPGQLIDCTQNTDALSGLSDLVLALALGDDCNENSIPDDCDIMEGGGSNDCDENGVPDECQCFEDVNGDGVVDIDDIFDLLAYWGDCADPEDCPWDITDDYQGCPDGVVNINDLFAILGNWGPCDVLEPQTPPQSIYDCLEYINNPQRFEACIEAMTLTGGGGP